MDTKTSKPTVKLTLPDGEIIHIPQQDGLRVVVYNNQIQTVRDEESFIAYHQKHPGTLANLITNATYALLLTENEINNMFMRSKSTKNKMIYYHDAKDNVHPYIFTTNYNLKIVPTSSLIAHTLQWLKGLLVSTHGVAAFDIIKEAEKKGKLKRLGGAEEKDGLDSIS